MSGQGIELAERLLALLGGATPPSIKLVASDDQSATLRIPRRWLAEAESACKAAQSLLTIGMVADQDELIGCDNLLAIAKGADDGYSDVVARSLASTDPDRQLLFLRLLEKAVREHPVIQDEYRELMAYLADLPEEEVFQAVPEFDGVEVVVASGTEADLRISRDCLADLGWACQGIAELLAEGNLTDRAWEKLRKCDRLDELAVALDAAWLQSWVLGVTGSPTQALRAWRVLYAQHCLRPSQDVAEVLELLAEAASL